MKYLLDTHVVVWFFDDKDKLPEKILRTILEPTNKKYVSVASAWELAIKVGVGRFVFKGGAERFLRVIHENGSDCSQ